MSDLFRKGLRLKTLGWGLIGIAAGVTVYVIGMRDNYTLRVFGITLPQWSITVASILFAGGGLVLTVSAFFTEQCAACRTALRKGTAVFSHDAEQDVLGAVRELDGSRLAQLEKQPDTKSGVLLELAWCPACEKVGRHAIDLAADYQTTSLQPEQSVNDDRFPSLVHVVETHMEFRNEDDDDD